MSAGHVKMERDWHEHELFAGDEYSRRDAWSWLIANAMWKARKMRVAGQVVALDRGQLSYSVRFLASKWGWSKSRVDRFLHLLADENMIELSGTVAGQKAGQSAGRSQLVITICNYSRFQDAAKAKRDSQRDSEAKKAGQSRDKEEEYKEKEDRGRAHALPENWSPEPFGSGEAKAIIAGWSRDRFAREVEKFRSTHGAKGSKFRNWQRAWQTWVLNSVDFSPRGQTPHNPLDPDGRYNFWMQQGGAAQ